MTQLRILERRGFLGGALATFPLALLGQQSPKAPTASAVAPVRAGEDRVGELHTLGVSSTAFKVLTRDSGGGLFIMEHSNRKKGGPPRHLHHNEDEWFYVIEGDYIAEVGSERFELKPGDSILGPREIPHAWAFVGDTPGKMLIAFAPANKMEAFFRDGMKRHNNAYSNSAAADDKEFFRAYGMELLGPPLSVK
jgi:quercetin dioxygenase-like cupin family protein